MNKQLMDQIRGLQRRRGERLDEAQRIVAAAMSATRDLTDDERKSVDAAQADATVLKGDIERLSALHRDGEELRDSAGRIVRPDSDLDLPASDLQHYSLVRAIRAAMDAPKNPRAWDGAQLELEASNEIAKRLGKQPQGFFVPRDWQRKTEKRDLLVGTNSAGGYTVATDLLAQNFIDILRNRLVVKQAGATFLSGLQGGVAIPRQTGAATAYWVAENSAVTESAQTFDQVTMTPKTVGGFTDYSRKLLLQASVDVEAFVRGDLAAVIARAIDLAALHGSGSSNQPTGIAATSGIGSVAGGTNGLAPAWSHIVGLETEVAIDNADVGTLAYVTNAKVRGKLKQVEKASNTAQFVWAGNELNGYNALVSNQVKSDLTKGSSSGVCSAIFFGNWADLFIGEWGTLDMLVDPYTGGTAGTVRVIALEDVDIAVRHAESFAAMLDALTT